MPFTLPEPTQKSAYVRQMFDRIAPFYEKMNRIMTLGQDHKWRRRVIQLLDPEDRKIYLDVGAGTGDLSRLITLANSSSSVIAVDMTREMMEMGRKNPESGRVIWVQADAQHLPFSNGVFNGIVSGFLFRNVTDIDQAMNEQARVVLNGGKVICLDTTPPVKNLLYPFIRLYLKWVLPFIGKMISGDPHAYTYLSESTARHLSIQELSQKMNLNGIVEVRFEKWMAGTMAIHSGKKAYRPENL